MPGRTILHGAVLALGNLFGIWLGFVAHALASGASQLRVQVPVAIVISLIFFVLWVRLVEAFAPERIRFRGARDAIWTYVLALAWGPAIFVPLHYVTQGYLTAFGNVLALWTFQSTVNILAAAAAALVTGRNGARTG
jgi:hypothetical protein